MHRDFDPGAYLPLPQLIIIILDRIFKGNILLTVYISLIQPLTALFVVYAISYKFISKKAASIASIYFAIWFGFILKQNVFDINLLIGILVLLMMAIFYIWLEKRSNKHLFLLENPYFSLKRKFLFRFRHFSGNPYYKFLVPFKH